MFSDESRFGLRHMDCRVTVWRRHGERFADCCTDRVTSFGGGSVMVWRQSQCREISRWNHATSGNPISQQSGIKLLLQDDNARPHRARIIRDFLQSLGLERMEWLQSWSLNYLGISLGCCQSDQHNHVGWLVEMGESWFIRIINPDPSNDLGVTSLPSPLTRVLWVLYLVTFQLKL